MADYDSLRRQYAAAGQEHVFTFYDRLSEDDQESLLEQLASIDPDHVNSAYKLSMEADSAQASSSSSSSSDISPPPADASSSTASGSNSSSNEDVGNWEQAGLDAIAAGQVAIILLAGGQGTRLGSSDPKGCYDIALPSHKSLFQLQAERIASLQNLAGRKANKSNGNVVLPWYIMTSGPTRAATEAFFTKNDFFGLAKANVTFFNQGVLPCLTNDGKMFMETQSRVAVAPDGNGGIYAALSAQKATGQDFTVLQDMKKRGIRYVYAYCVDNCLAKVGDPVFLGYCIGKDAQCGTKVVKKTQASESVGVVALKGGKWNVIEYSEISKELSEARDESGELVYRAANIANHFYNVSFLDTGLSSGKMAYHIARKKIPHTDLSSGQQVKPDKPNGMKLEQFIFDVLPLLGLHEHALLEVERKNEFSPLKNAPRTGSDDPETSRRDLLALQRRWLKNAGANISDEVEVEISPLLSYSGESLEIVKGKTLKAGIAETRRDLESLFV